MEVRKFAWLPRFTNMIAKVPSAEHRYILMWSIIQYGTYGTEPELDYPLDVFFDEAKEDIDNYLSFANHGKKGGRPPKKKAANQDKESGDKSPLSDSKKPPFYDEKDPLAIPILSLPNLSSPFNKEEKESFPLACLAALNEELRGIAPVEYTRNPNGGFLAGMEGTYTVEDVRQMVAFKRDQWAGTEFQGNLNPGTLFSPDHFEAYVAASKMPPPTKPTRGKGVVDDELASYAS